MGVQHSVMEVAETRRIPYREGMSAFIEASSLWLVAAGQIDCSGGETSVGVPLARFAGLRAPAYPPDALPPELAAIPPEKPGSRGLGR
jgi:hypothetical protein